MNKAPVAMWSLIFMVLGVGVMSLALISHDEKVSSAFLMTGSGIVLGAFAVFQHSQGATSAQNPTDPAQPEK